MSILLNNLSPLAWIWAQTVTQKKTLPLYGQCFFGKHYPPFQIQSFHHSVHFHPLKVILQHTICSVQLNWGFLFFLFFWIRWSRQCFCFSILRVHFLTHWGVQRTTLQSAELQRQPGVREFDHSGILNAGGNGRLLLPHCSAAVKAARQRQREFRESIRKDNFVRCQSHIHKSHFPMITWTAEHRALSLPLSLWWDA